VNAGRTFVLVRKDLREFRANPAAVLPILIVMIVMTVAPFLIVAGGARITGSSLASDAGIAKGIARAKDTLPELAALPSQAAGEAFLLDQFLLLFLVTPTIGAVSLAAYAVVGEKQGRTLEPLLTTPLSTADLLVAKGLAAFLPAIAAECLSLVLFAILTVLLAEPGVLRSLLTVRNAVLIGLVGPCASLAALQAAIAVSSRVNDPRSAQQIAVLLVLPVMAAFVGQIVGAFTVSAGLLVLAAAVLAGVWILLVMFSVALFDRETILTRWTA
jgi:ABC-2 type transport system permease protein